MRHSHARGESFGAAKSARPEAAGGEAKHDKQVTALAMGSHPARSPAETATPHDTQASPLRKTSTLTPKNVGNPTHRLKEAGPGITAISPGPPESEWVEAVFARQATRHFAVLSRRQVVTLGGTG